MNDMRDGTARRKHSKKFKPVARLVDSQACGPDGARAVWPSGRQAGRRRAIALYKK